MILRFELYKHHVRSHRARPSKYPVLGPLLQHRGLLWLIDKLYASHPGPRRLAAGSYSLVQRLVRT
jgi:hypothetical protein